MSRRSLSLRWIALWVLALGAAAFLGPTALFALIQLIWSH